MTVIAYDGKTIAADKRACLGELACTSTKLIEREIEGRRVVIGWTGDQEKGIIVSEWYLNGADPEKWPECQTYENFCRVIVFDGGIKEYECLPVAQVVENEYWAWGSGRDFAMGALASGKTAIEAVEIALSLCISCGNGVDFFEVG